MILGALMVLQTGSAPAAAEDKVLKTAQAPIPAGLGDLPVNEVPAVAKSKRLALLITGDGGWAFLDRNLSAELAANGISVVALDSLKYFWKKRTPEETAADIEHVLRHYLAAWQCERIVLIGYSFGADALPFIVSRLPQDLRERVETLNLLGLGMTAGFEIHIADWVPGVDRGELPIEPEILQLHGMRVLCIHGAGEKHSLCPALPADRFRSVEVGSGHRFSGDYKTLAARILTFLKETA